jgi:hypothetical protein
MLKALAAICCLAREDVGEWIPEPRLTPEDLERDSSSSTENYIGIKLTNSRSHRCLGDLDIFEFTSNYRFHQCPASIPKISDALFRHLFPVTITRTTILFFEEPGEFPEEIGINITEESFHIVHCMVI